MKIIAFEAPKNVSSAGTGFVEYVNHMGEDWSIADAARVSLASERYEDDERNEKLLRYMFTHGHTSPFEMIELQIRVKCPLFVARQWMRHRTWSYNEVSRRYTDEDLDFFFPPEWRMQNKDGNKQGGDELASSVFQHVFSKHLVDSTDYQLSRYRFFIQSGVSREQARMALPQNMYTTFIAKVDGNNLMKFLSERLHKDSQYEMRVYADAVDQVFQHYFPTTHKIFHENREEN